MAAMTPAIVLRASGGAGIGIGHLQRCAALAQALKGDVLVSSPERPDVMEELGLPAHGRLDDAGWIAALPEGAVVVLDTLHHGNAMATAADVATLKAAGHRVVVIDSMPPDHFTAPDPGCLPDLLVTPYHAADKLRPPLPDTRWLAGSAYAILPEAYRHARAKAAAVKGEGAILVTCGGADPTGLSLGLARACARGVYPVDVVIGPQFAPDLVADLEALTTTCPQITLHRGLSSLIPLYLRARLVVGRPGLVRYEAACLGRRALYLWDHDEYRAYFEAFRDSGLAEIHFTADPGGKAAFFDRIATLVTSREPDLGLVSEAADAVDGNGAARVAEAIMAMCQKGPR
ncbi:hypothetical protein [Nioella sediminis]|jgi:spore coat polysaccharide biosynthesis predicted glycosyltransferase SpsG|uniref:hypothetical protein n=1 Tax=Nioella sediminis TaxID=1912092 RepID=UPI0008FD7994|nr:hypothetical protein [Nioella sediminis]TBX21174.1 hypothetical protein TK43_13245 [Roseovarius sp. JS7-11]